MCSLLCRERGRSDSSSGGLGGAGGGGQSELQLQRQRLIARRKALQRKLSEVITDCYSVHHCSALEFASSPAFKCNLLLSLSNLSTLSIHAQSSKYVLECLQA